MVLRLLCMMIDALRCAGVVYLPGMMNILCILFLDLSELSLLYGTLVIDKCDLYLEISRVSRSSRVCKTGPTAAVQHQERLLSPGTMYHDSQRA
jgi:hypothetical protein